MLPYPVDAKYVVYLCLLLGFCGFPKIAVIIYAFCHPSTCGPDFFEEEDIPEQEIVTYD
jgi:hypothetical protein